MTTYSNNNNNKTNDKTPWTENEFTNVMLRDTANFQEKYGFEVGSNGSAWNNESDAFRHAYMQAYLTLRFGENIAEIFGNSHEREGNKKYNQAKSEEIMDFHNNSIGREIGNEIKNEHKNEKINPDSPEVKEIIARKVAERMQAGKLILDPSGRRTPKKKLNGISNGVNDKGKSSSQKGCVGSYQVSGYTRSDGTDVKSYTRTCGAKHTGMSKEERLAGREKYKGKRFQDIPLTELEEAISYFI